MPLSTSTGGPHLEHHLPAVRDEPGGLGGSRDLVGSAFAVLFVLGEPEVEGQRDAALVLDVPRPVGLGEEPLQLGTPLQRLGIRLEPVHSDVLEPVEADEPLGLRRRPAADAGDEAVAADEALQLRFRLLGNRCVLRPLDDRRERPVHVEDHRGHLGLAPKPHEQGRGAHRPTLALCALPSYTHRMSRPEDLWIPLVDEPIGTIVAQLQDEDPELDALVSSPHRLLAFRTFAYIRVGLLLGELLVERDVEPYDGTETWVDRLLADPEIRAMVALEVRAVAEEIAADPSYSAQDPLGPDEETRRRFREFAKRRLEAT